MIEECIGGGRYDMAESKALNNIWLGHYLRMENNDWFRMYFYTKRYTKYWLYSS